VRSSIGLPFAAAAAAAAAVMTCVSALCREFLVQEFPFYLCSLVSFRRAAVARHWPLLRGARSSRPRFSCTCASVSYRYTTRTDMIPDCLERWEALACLLLKLLFMSVGLPTKKKNCMPKHRGNREGKWLGVWPAPAHPRSKGIKVTLKSSGWNMVLPRTRLRRLSSVSKSDT